MFTLAVIVGIVINEVRSIEEGLISTLVDNDKIVHVMVGLCWAMMGVVGSGLVEWKYRAGGLKMSK